MQKSARFAVVTPYHKETQEVLTRCLRSVKGQTLKADHFLVADGFPQSWLDEEPVRHIKLDAAHGDYGNVARGTGALLAVSEDYDGIGFLDADNWYDPDHVERCVAGGAVAKGGRADIVFAKRRFVRPDGSPIAVPDDRNHIDTNCLWFLPGSFHLVHYWVTMPKKLSCFGDRVFFQMLRERKVPARQLQRETVNYLCLWESIYQAAGETPPPGAKPNLQFDLVAWHRSLTPEQRRVAVKLCGTDIFAVLAPQKKQPSKAPQRP